MLSDEKIQLLTAFVDGELNPGQRKAVTLLLSECSDARELLRQLQENSHRVKSLPRYKVEPSLVDEIMRAIAEQQAQPRCVAPARRRRWLPYVAASLAASLLIGLFGVICWRVLHTGGDHTNRNDGPAIVQQPKGTPERIAPEPGPGPAPTPILPAPKKTNPLLARMTEAVVRDFSAVPPPEKVFSASFREILSGKLAMSQLKDELSRKSSVQLNITVKNNDVAMARLKDVLKQRGIKLVTDPSAGKSLKQKSQAKIEYLVYAENLTSDEVSKIMGELGQGYVVGLNNTQRNVESPYQKVTLASIEAGEKQKVAKLMGVPAKAIEPKNGKEAKDPKRDRQVVLLPMTAGGAPSAEVRQFVNQRRAASPGSIQLLLKIRQE